MGSQSSSSKQPTVDAYETDNLGGAGEEYSRLIAIRLLSRAAVENRPFKLAIEFKAAGKFDDVAFYNESAKEWWLVQAKHSLGAKEVTREAMFSKDATTGDFSMVKYFKSYLQMKQRWQYGGESIRLFLFTNRPLNRSVETKSVVVSEMLMFDEGNHVQLVPSQEDIKVTSNFANYAELCGALVKLFIRPDDGVNNVLKNHSKLVKEVLIKANTKLKFSKIGLRNNLNSDFHAMLKSAFAKETKKGLLKLSVVAPAQFSEFWHDSAEDNDLPLVNEDTVKEFINYLVLSVSQPNVRRLEEAIQADWRRWMKSWIRPDVFRKLTVDQLSEPFNTFKKLFDDWEKPYTKSVRRQFLTHNECAECLETVKKKLKSYVKLYGRKSYVGLDAADKYYVRRRITFGKRNESTSNISDEEFAEWLAGDWSNQQCIALFAEPGMGKSTLWQHLAFRVQQNHHDVEVFLIFLNDFKEKLVSVTENANFDNAASILDAVISAEHVKVLLDKHQKVIIFMDAFDELKEENKHSVLNFVNIAKSSKINIKFLISSRERCKTQLEESLQFETIDVIPLDEVSRSDFLRSFWNAKDDEKFEAYSGVLLNKFEQDAPRADIDFIGLPLTMKMLAEIFGDSFEKYMDSTDTAELESLLSEVCINVIFLYEQFITKCISLTMNKKWKLDPNEKSFHQMFEPQIKSVTPNYQLLAIEQLKPDYQFEEFERTRLDNFYQSIRGGQQESLLLETVNGGPRFAHQSYAEFFCATFLYNQLSNLKTLQKQTLKKFFDDHDVVCMFFLKILDTKISAQQISTDSISRIVKNFPAAYTIKECACNFNCANLLYWAINADKSRNFIKRTRVLQQSFRSTILRFIQSSEEGEGDIREQVVPEKLLPVVAAGSNACEAMKVLLKAGESIDAETDEKVTPLYAACEKGHLDMIKLLVEKGAKVNHRLLEDESPLWLAAEVDSEYNENKNIALMYAAIQGKFDMVQRLIASGARTDYCDLHKRTALHWAAYIGRTEIVAELLDCGANINARDKDGYNPLHFAACKYSFDVAQLLVGRKTTNTFTCTKSPHILNLLARVCRVDAKEDSDSDEDTDEEDDSFVRANLMEAAGTQLGVARLLIARGAELNAVDLVEETALHEAARSGKTAVVEELCKCGANINAQNYFGETPLHFAAAEGHTDIVRALLARSADINLVNTWMKQTALHIAAKKDRITVVEELLKGGAEINVKDLSTKTPLEVATAECHTNIVRLLEAHRDMIQRTKICKNSQIHSGIAGGK